MSSNSQNAPWAGYWRPPPQPQEGQQRQLQQFQQTYNTDPRDPVTGLGDRFAAVNLQSLPSPPYTHDVSYASHVLPSPAIGSYEGYTLSTAADQNRQYSSVVAPLPNPYPSHQTQQYYPPPAQPYSNNNTSAPASKGKGRAFDTYSTPRPKVSRDAYRERPSNSRRQDPRSQNVEALDPFYAQDDDAQKPQTSNGNPTGSYRPHKPHKSGANKQRKEHGNDVIIRMPTSQVQGSATSPGQDLNNNKSAQSNWFEDADGYGTGSLNTHFDPSSQDDSYLPSEDGTGQRTPRPSSPTLGISPYGNNAPDVGALDERYVVEPSNRFIPGEVFKTVWSEPLGSVKNETMTEFEERSHLGQRFYMGIRRFIVVANDEGHCTCVPILTYERRGCTKKGVKPAKHGIIYHRGSKPRYLEGEPVLGFDPVQMELDYGQEKLAPQSRVNYSKLVTVEHNVKVFFVGRIRREDFDNVVQNAVDKCWSEKKRDLRRPRY